MNEQNQIALPLQRIEEELLQCARPGWYGELCLEIQILESAAFEVNLKIERRTITNKDVTKDQTGLIPSNERFNKVRQRLSEVQEKFRLACPIYQMRALFKDGNLVSIEFLDRKTIPLAVPAVAIR